MSNRRKLDELTRDLGSAITLLIATLEQHAPGVGVSMAMGMIASDNLGDEAKDVVGSAATAAHGLAERLKANRERLWPGQRLC